MLNSIVAMRYNSILYVFLDLIVSIGLSASIRFQAELDVNIQSPNPGEAVQGLVQIIGNTDIEGFASSELAFSFSSDQTQTWFLIKDSSQPVRNDVLGEWDTSTLTDNTYTLRLTVFRKEGEPILVIVEEIRVRNYSPIETATPTITPVNGSDEPEESTPTPLLPTSAPPPKATLTPLAKNPAELSPAQIKSSTIRGGILAVLFLIFLGLYSAARRR